MSDPDGARRSRRALAGLARVTARRLVRRTLLWGFGLASVVTSSGTAYRDTYAPADRAGLTATIGANPAMSALLGPARDLGTVGGFLVWRVGIFVVALIALFGLLTASALTRGEEESGLREAVWAGALPRRAPLLVAAAGTSLAVTVVAGLCAAAGAAQGMPGPTALTWWAAMSATGWLFTGLALLTAQLGGTRRAASGLAGTVLGASYLLRALADGTAGGAWVRWCGPLGWYEQVAPETRRRVGPVLLLVVGALALAAVAARLEGRRDLGGAWLRDRPGPPAARRWPGRLGSPESLASRLFAGATTAWLLGLATFGAVLASMAPGVGDLLGDNPSMQELIRSASGGTAGDLGLAYLGMTFQVLAVAVAAVAVQGVLQFRREESGGQAELVRSCPVSARRLLAAHSLTGLGAGALVAVALGGVSQLAWTASGGSGGRVWQAGANLLPLVAVWVGVSALAVALAPRVATGLAWGGLATGFGASFVGALAGWPTAATSWSPFAHVASVPAVAVDVPAALVLTAAGVATLAAALVLVGRRDLTT